MASPRAIRENIVMTVAVLVALAGSVQDQALAFQAATPVPRADGSCFIPQEQPVGHRVREGDRVWVTCISGEILVLLDRSRERAERKTAGRHGRNAEGVPGSNYRRVVALERSVNGLAATAVWPIDPDPSECDPNTQSSSLAVRNEILGSPASGAPTASPSGSITLGAVRPANPSLVAAVILVLRELVACAGDDVARISVTDVQDLGAGRLRALVIRTVNQGDQDRVLVDFVLVGNELRLAAEIERAPAGTPAP